MLYPGLEIKESRRPVLSQSKRNWCSWKYVLPGLIDMHGHISSQREGSAEYVFKLWMAHGITTIRDPSCGQGFDWVFHQKEESKK